MDQGGLSERETQAPCLLSRPVVLPVKIMAHLFCESLICHFFFFFFLSQVHTQRHTQPLLHLILVPTASAARRLFSLAISSEVPCISGTSTARLSSSMLFPIIAFTSASLFLFPVMKFSFLGTGMVTCNLELTESQC